MGVSRGLPASGGSDDEVSGCTVEIDLIFLVKWEARSSAKSKDGKDVGGLRGKEKV